MSSYDSAGIKRMILKETDTSTIGQSIAARMRDPDLKNSDDIVEMGNAFEALVEMKGWVFLEEYMIRNANPIGLVFQDEKNDLQRGMARGLIQLMQFVDATIKAKNKIQEERNAQRKANTETA
jgi:hypothetical protein